MIGIFDSGVGGFSVLRALREVLPDADVIYFGDIKHAPYGIRSQQELSELTTDAIQLLQERGAENIISACNSVSASLVTSLSDALSLTPKNLIEMVGPTATHFRDSESRLALCATPATIQSGIYQNMFRMMGKEVECTAIPELAGAIEFGKSDTEIERIIREAYPEDARDFDTLILSCTHYPLVIDIFRRVLGPEITVCDPAMPVAEQAAKVFTTEVAGSGVTQFLISTESAVFRKTAEEVFPEMSYTVEVTE